MSSFIQRMQKTLQLTRIGVHLDSREKYVPSHNLDQTAKRYLPQSVNEGFPHFRHSMTPQQSEKIAEIMLLSEQSRMRGNFRENL